MERWEELIPESIANKYEFFNFNSALEILTQSHPGAFAEIVRTLEQFDIRIADITAKGGNESPIPKKLSAILRPLGWIETEISGDLFVRLLDGKNQKRLGKNIRWKNLSADTKLIM